jgi:hypothetical protein
LLLLVGLLAASADAQEGTSQSDLPTCRGRAGGLELATSLDFAGVARPFASSGAPSDGVGDGEDEGDDTQISSYELYCPYGELPVGAADDATAPLELTLRWALVPALDGPGCTEDEQQDVAGGAVGTAADPDRRAQVDWSTTEDGPTAEAAVQAAENLLASTPADAVACDADVAAGEGETASGSDDSTTTTPILVIVLAGVVGLAALVVVLVRRRRNKPAQPAPASAVAAAAAVPAGGALAATPGEIPLLAAPGAPPAPVAGVPALLGIDALRQASPALRASRAGQLAVVAQACNLMARRDREVIDAHLLRGLPVPGGGQLPALADALDALAHGAGQLARGERSGGAASGDPRRLDALLAATNRLLHAHQGLLGRPDPVEGP